MALMPENIGVPTHDRDGRDLVDPNHSAATMSGAYLMVKGLHGGAAQFVCKRPSSLSQYSRDNEITYALRLG